MAGHTGGARSLGLPPELGGIARRWPVLWRLPRRVTVRGSSMAPALRDGDVLLALPGARVRTGDVALVRWAARPAQLSVKRLGAATGGLWQARGDHHEASTDSRTLGPAQALAAVPVRLWPRPARLRGAWGRAGADPA